MKALIVFFTIVFAAMGCIAFVIEACEYCARESDKQIARSKERRENNEQYPAYDFTRATYY